MALMQVLILRDWLDTPEINGEPFTVYLTLFSAITTLTVQMVLLGFDANAASEPFTLLMLENMTARIGWLPFRNEIRTTSVALFLDYGNIRGGYGF